MKPFTAIDRYIFRLVLTPMLSVFAIAASLLVVDQLLRLLDFVATEGGPISVVFKMLANLLPDYASLAIPFGLMLGILLAFRKLAISSELDVLRGVGLSYTRLLRVPYAITLGLLVLNFVIVGYLQPIARYYYEELQYELRSGALGASIKIGEFNTLEDRMALRVERSEDDGLKLIGIFARVADRDGQVLSIFAREGRFLANRENRDTVILRLSDGTLIHDTPNENARVLSFTEHDLPIDLPAIEAFRERGESESEFIIPELLSIGWAESSNAELRTQLQATFNYRMVEVLMMLFLPLLAVSLAIPPKRSTSSLGVFVSIVLLVAYHKINEYGQSVAALGRVDPYLALWGPFAVLGLLIVWMYYRTAYVPGAQPIGFLEKLFSFGRKKVKAITGKKRSQQMKAATHAA
ncbi:MAG TPA: LptF/LptG family permease [Sphingomonadaceae bacterium]|nr:LptF/LptG family permease [Sphingomonadaceae bacterium]